MIALAGAPLHAKQRSAVIPAHPSKIHFDSLKWNVPLGDACRVALENGCIAYIAKDSLLPLVKITAYIRHGSLADPKGKEGLTDLLANLMRTGGTVKFPADTLDELIDLLALRFGFSARESQLTFSGSFLSEYTDNAFAIIKEMLFHPVFNGKKLEKERKIMVENIRHQFDNPGPALYAAFEKMMYAGQPSSRMRTAASVGSVTRDDLVKLHRKVFTPANIIFCIAGCFNPDSMRSRIEHLIPADTAARGTDAFPAVNINRSPDCIFVHKEISQAYVRLGLPLFQRPHPDFYPMSVLNYILGGGGFTSRLGKSVRSDAGLTYSIHSEAQSNYTYPATFFISFFTKNETFTRAVALTLKEVHAIVDSGVTEEELSNAKSSLIDELPSMFRSADDIVSTYGWNEYYHRAPDHYRVYPDKIRAITRKDLQRVAHRYLTVDSMAIAVVGDSTVLINQESKGFSLKGRKRKTILPDAIPLLP
jgi:zinc protease